MYYTRALRISLLGWERESERMTQKYACDRNLLILLVSKLSSSVTRKNRFASAQFIPLPSAENIRNDVFYGSTALLQALSLPPPLSTN